MFGGRDGSLPVDPRNRRRPGPGPDGDLIERPLVRNVPLSSPPVHRMCQPPDPGGGELKCKCGFTPKIKMSLTDKNYNEVFFSCGSFLQEPCGYFQWLHCPLWCPREKALSSLRRWVKDDGKVPIPLLKGKGHEMEGSLPWQMHYVKRNKPPTRQWGL